MKKYILLLFLVLIACSPKDSPLLKLHGYLADQAIFQRNQPIVIRGISTPKTKVNGLLGKAQTSTTSSESGKFKLVFDPLEAQLGLTLKIDSEDTTAVFNDIAIGDVWLASGQSNMVWPLKKTDNSVQVINSSSFPNIRFFKTAKAMEFEPIDSLRKDINWIKGDEKEVGEISGVAYYFAKSIHEKTKIPIGVVISSWGGTGIETWMSKETVDQFDYLVEKRKSIEHIKQSVEEVELHNKRVLDNFIAEVFRKGIGVDQKWYLPQKDLTDWKKIRVPGFWEDQLPEYSNFDGAMWYRKKFDLKPTLQNGDLRMWLSQIDDHDQVWVNGKFIGETFYKDSWTNYLIPKDILKAEGNEIVIRIFDIGGKGGTTGLETYFDFYLEGNNETRGRLNGMWFVKAGEAYQDTGHFRLELAKVQPNYYPSLLFNGMIAPYLDFSFKGVIWYQGEQNKANAYQYRELFPAMIKDWRRAFSSHNLPFYFTQIANFGQVAITPEESGAAELREAQFMTLSQPHTGMACTIDIGDEGNIHPTNKKDVGERLARHALKNQYGFEKIITDGPIYQSHWVKGDKIIIAFKNAKGLKTTDGKSPVGFAIASEGGEFVWAKAAIDGKTIILHNEQVKKNVHVRYGWAEAPIVNLVNEAGLPAYPFRTDNRQAITCCQ